MEMCFEIPVCLFFNYLITPKKKKISLWYTTIRINPAIALYLLLFQEISFTFQQSTQSRLSSSWDLKVWWTQLWSILVTSFRVKDVPYNNLYSACRRWGTLCLASAEVYIRILAKLQATVTPKYLMPLCVPISAQGATHGWATSPTLH